MKTGTKVQSAQFGLGTILEVNGSKALVDFGGTTKELMTAFLKAPKAAKVKSYMREEKEDIINFTSIVNLIKGSSIDRGSAFYSFEIFNTIEKMADLQGHFAGSIVENARNKKFISDKQAAVVAYFAKNNGLINS